LIELGWFN